MHTTQCAGLALAAGLLLGAGCRSEGQVEQPTAPASRESQLKLGDEAPDFALKTLDGTAEVQLSSYQGECPVALVFGSYT